MTEEDAKKTTQMAAKSLIHVSVKFGKKAADKSADVKKTMAKMIGHGLDMYSNRTRVFQGKHALKEFIKFDKNSRAPIGQIDVNATDFKEFAHTCKENGVDFAIVKDSVDENVMHFFFAGKNAEVMSHLFEEYAKNKYQQDLKNEMLPDQEEREREQEELELDPKDQGEKEVNPKSKRAQDQKNIADMERTAEDLNESVEKETQAMTEKAESLLEEAMEDMELPEMER
jgi:hypothetical protein